MSGCGAFGGGGDLCGRAGAGGRGAAGVVGAAGGAGCAARRAGGARRGARAAAEARLAQLVVAAEPRSALAREAGPVTGDGADARCTARPRRAWTWVVSDRAGEGGRRALAGALRLRPCLWRG